MTNAELLAKIREEIERRRSLLTQHSKLTYDLILETFIKEYDDLLSFISTLESEKPMNQDKELEKEFNHYCFDFKDPDTGEDIPKNQISFNVEDALNVARHFAEWGAEYLANSNDEIVINGHKVAYNMDKDVITMEETPNDLEEAAKHYASVTDQEARGIDFIREVFIAGAEWQKDQLMKEAVEGEVMLNPYPTICLDDCKDYDFNEGDKVRIIIVKEDEK